MIKYTNLSSVFLPGSALTYDELGMNPSSALFFTGPSCLYDLLCIPLVENVCVDHLLCNRQRFCFGPGGAPE